MRELLFILSVFRFISSRLEAVAGRLDKQEAKIQADYAAESERHNAAVLQLVASEVAVRQARTQANSVRENINTLIAD